GTVESSRRRRPLAGLLPLLLTGAIVVSVAAIGQVQTARSRADAEQALLVEREKLTGRAAAFYSDMFNPRTLDALLATVPFGFDGGRVDQVVLGAMKAGALFGNDAHLYLTTPDGRLVASAPAGLPLPIPVDSPAFRGA